MSGSLESYNEKQITVITGDGRIIVVSCARRNRCLTCARAGPAQGLRPNRQSDIERRARTRVQRRQRRRTGAARSVHHTR
ncbi:unnamed protein product [Sphagnum balticum]